MQSRQTHSKNLSPWCSQLEVEQTQVFYRAQAIVQDSSYQEEVHNLLCQGIHKQSKGLYTSVRCQKCRSGPDRATKERAEAMRLSHPALLCCAEWERQGRGGIWHWGGSR